MELRQFANVINPVRTERFIHMPNPNLQPTEGTAILARLNKRHYFKASRNLLKEIPTQTLHPTMRVLLSTLVGFAEKLPTPDLHAGTALSLDLLLPSRPTKFLGCLTVGCHRLYAPWIDNKRRSIGTPTRLLNGDFFFPCTVQPQENQIFHLMLRPAGTRLFSAPVDRWRPLGYG